MSLHLDSRNRIHGRMQHVGAGGRRAASKGSALVTPALIVTFLLLPIAAIGVNAPLGVYACLVLGIAISLLWRPGEPPILLFVVGYQWLQAAMGPLYGNLVGLDLEQIATYAGDHNRACFLQLTGVLAIAIGMKLTVGERVKNLRVDAGALGNARPIQFWLYFYIYAWIFSAVCTAVAWQAGGLQQPLLALAQLKWAAFVVLTFAIFGVRGRSKVIWFIVFGFEFIMSIGGFFADFKSIFFYSIFGIMVSNIRISFKSMISLIGFGAILLLLSVVWTSIKSEYRNFANSGTGDQIVLANYYERISEINRLVSELTFEDIGEGSDALARRVMYYQFFGAAVAYVPTKIDFTGGAIWGEAISRTFTPRLLFSDKRAINDSDITNQYTGLSVATAEKGASISMGAIAEAYIDFGTLFMFLPITLLGGCLGYIYRILLNLPRYRNVFGAALSTIVIIPAAAVETSILKLIPALALCLLASFFILNFLVPKIFDPGRRQTLKPRTAETGSIFS